MENKYLYLMPGLGASPKIFELLKFPNSFVVKHLSWISPFKNEKLSSYAIRMSKLIKHENPILIGVSFGGILVQEVSKVINCEKVIIISSLKSNKELPIHMKVTKHTKVHKFIPFKWIGNIENLALFVFGDSIKLRVDLYKKYLSHRDPEYLSWAYNALVNWEQESNNQSIIHIHGMKDNIFPIRKIKKPFIKIKGSHAIILTQANWFNNNLPKLILS